MSYYALSVLLSAFLLFQVQPLIAKYILPWFGSTPLTWSASMLFFQALLMGGNAYAYWLAGRLNTRKQGAVHLALLGISLSLLLVTGLAWGSPITPGAYWKPHGIEAPLWQILEILAVSVGLPFFILSTNNPLMQAWFNLSAPSRSPYRLYALSNLGSLVGLVSYPFLVEPALALKTQANLWTAGYVIFAVCAGYGALGTMRQPTTPSTRPPEEKGASPRLKIRLFWVALSACASVMLLAITNHITQEISAIPFFWVLPLTLYLLSFILCFSSQRWYSRTWYTVALFIANTLFCWAFYYRPATLSIWAYIGLYSLILFACCMICHGELACLRPSPRYLTSFYLLVSAGGAMGGVAVNLVAPYVFSDFWELPLGLLSCWGLLLVAFARGWRSDQGRRTSWLTDSLLMGGIAMMGVTLFLYVGKSSANTLATFRNFYGVLRVREVNTDDPHQRAYKLVHGTTLHGLQFVEEEKHRLPTAYYTEESGGGLAILHHPRREAGLRIGVIGLGVGTLAAYGRPSDVFRFYEINPEVTRLAEGAGGYFTYLEECPAQVEIVPGDARLSMERELAAGDLQRFDLLVVDAFSDGSIPAHLLTKEAFEIYLSHLQPDGIIALHISNHYLDLPPVVQELADYFQLSTALINHPGDGDRAFWSLWMLTTRNEEFLKQPQIAGRSLPQPTYTGLRLWTNDYTNLFQILRRRQAPGMLSRDS